MIRIEFNEQELQGFLNRIREIITNTRGAVAAHMEEAANEAYEKIKERTPVLTGEAVDAWKLEQIDKTSWRISNKVDYIIHLEYGTRPHIITAKGGSVLHWVNDDGQHMFAKMVNHPGTRPYAMVRTTIQEMRKDMRGFVAEVKDDIVG